jgi:hypothetical protein
VLKQRLTNYPSPLYFSSITVYLKGGAAKQPAKQQQGQKVSVVAGTQKEL